MRDAAKDLAMCEAATAGPWFVRVKNGDFAKIAEGVVLGANPNDLCFVTKSRVALPHWIQRAVVAEEREKKLVAALQLIAEESEDIISVDCAWDALRAYDEVKAESEDNMPATPEPIREWIRQQTDLSPVERDELAADMEGYFRQRKERIRQPSE